MRVTTRNPKVKADLERLMNHPKPGIKVEYVEQRRDGAFVYTVETTSMLDLAHEVPQIDTAGISLG